MPNPKRAHSVPPCHALHKRPPSDPTTTVALARANLSHRRRGSSPLRCSALCCSFAVHAWFVHHCFPLLVPLSHWSCTSSPTQCMCMCSNTKAVPRSGSPATPRRIHRRRIRNALPPPFHLEFDDVLRTRSPNADCGQGPGGPAPRAPQRSATSVVRSTGEACPNT